MRESKSLAEDQTCGRTPEWTSLVLTRQVNKLELPFTTTDVRVDEFLYVNKSLYSLCVSSENLDNSYGLFFQSLHECFGASKCQLCSFLWMDWKLSYFIKNIFISEDELKNNWFW